MNTIDEKTCSESTFAELVTFFKKRSGLSYKKISKRVEDVCGVFLPERTIISWANGLSKRPREWQYIAGFARGLKLPKEEFDCLLLVTDHPSVDELWQKADDEERTLLEFWYKPKDKDDGPILEQEVDMAPRGRKVFGRNHLIEQIAGALTGEPRLCFLTGMGGVGKTALAIAAANHLRDGKTFTNGILWANAKESTVEQIVELWGNVLNIQWGGVSGTHGRIDRLRSAISRRKMLVVLDDVESVIFRNLLPSLSSESAVLITTRSKEIASTLTDGTGLTIHLEPLAEEASLEMMAAVLPAQVDAEREAAAAICKLLGYLPLAITICMTLCKARSYTLAQMQKRLSELDKRLDMTRRPEAERGHVLAFEQSWEQLTTAQKEAYIALAPFAGRKFTAASFARVANLPPSNAADVLHELSGLSLIDTADGAFDQHTLLKDFAEMKAADTLPALQLRYAEQYLAQANDEPAAIITLWTHLMAGLQYADAQKNKPLIHQIITVLEPHWLRTGRYSDARTAYALLDQTDLSAQTHFIWGMACLEQSSWDEAKHHLQESLNLSTSSDDYVGMAKAQIYLARIAMNQQKLDEANDLLQQAWRNANMTDNVQQLGDILHRMARIHFWKGEWGEATKLCQQAIDAHQLDSSDSLGLWRTYLLRADIALSQNNLIDAEKDCERAEQIAEREEYEAERGLTYFLRAKIERKNGRSKKAQLVAYKALEKFEEMGDANTEAHVLNTLCLLDLNWHQSDPTHDLAPARTRCERMLELYKALNAPRNVIIALVTRGGLERADNNLNAACHSWQAALSLVEKTPYEKLKKHITQLLDETNGTS